MKIKEDQMKLEYLVVCQTETHQQWTRTPTSKHTRRANTDSWTQWGNKIYMDVNVTVWEYWRGILELS